MNIQEALDAQGKGLRLLSEFSNRLSEEGKKDLHESFTWLSHVERLLKIGSGHEQLEETDTTLGNP